ncbi:exported hypothetical protein [Frankia canadensis]|uniref:Copper chaperone PCu(A)C n=1 Tax=Frankia canadensis TaxID=1836972 RepID=A0A2I2KQD1_9ACTN|nr:exported hypothetical protein [Frankia canadensis]SOU55165.1 exported hypothetical protein [Frankia canadensis]
MRPAEPTGHGRRRVPTAVLTALAAGLIASAVAGCSSTGGPVAVSGSSAQSQPPATGHTLAVGRAGAKAITITGAQVTPLAPGTSITANSSTAGPSASTASIHLAIHNAAAADTLTAASSELGGSITLVTAPGDTPTRGVAIPAGHTVTIGAPAGPRLLLRGATLRPAGTLPIVLTFTRAGQIELFAPIPGPAS